MAYKIRLIYVFDTAQKNSLSDTEIYYYYILYN